MVWIGRDLYRSSLSNPAAMSRDTFHWTRLLKAPSSLALNTAREREPQLLSIHNFHGTHRIVGLGRDLCGSSRPTPCQGRILQSLPDSQKSFCPPANPIYILSMMYMIWNISTGHPGLAAWLCFLPALVHLLIS